MLFQKKEEPKQSATLGEDFDLYPDLGAQHQYQNDAQSENGAPASPAEESEEIERSPFQVKIASYSEMTWKKLQIAGGLLLGLLAGLSLTVLNGMQTFSSYGLLLAVVFALLIPNLFERKVDRRIPVARVTLIITLLVCLSANLIYGLVILPSLSAQ